MPLTKITTDNIDFSSNLVFSNVYSMNVTTSYSVNGSVFANTTGVYATYLGGNTASDLRTYTDNRSANAYSNAISYSGNAAAAYANAIAYSGNAAAAYSNAVTIATNLAGNAYSNAIAYSGNAAAAYANAVSYTNTNFVNTSNFSANLSNYQTTAGLSANVATLTANNSTNLGGVAAASYVQNTDSRTLSGNLSFSGTNVAFSSNTAVILPRGTTAQRPTGAAGMLRYNANTAKFEGYTSAWGNIGGGAAIGDTPPANPGTGDLWWNSADGRMYVYYADANTSQWVDISAAGAGQYLSLAGGTVTGNVIVTGDLTVTKTQAAISVTSTGNANPYVAFNAPSLNTTYIFVDKAGAGQLVADNAYGHVWNTSGTERMRVDAFGRFTTPSQPFFYGQLPQNTSKGANWAPIANKFTNVIINRGNHYNTTTGNFTCPVAGDYEIKIGGFINTAGDGQRVAVQFYKNGGTYQIAGGQLSDGDSPFPILSLIIPCNANDTVGVGEMYSPNALSLSGTLPIYGFFLQVRLLG